MAPLGGNVRRCRGTTGIPVCDMKLMAISLDKVLLRLVIPMMLFQFALTPCGPFTTCGKLIVLDAVAAGSPFTTAHSGPAKRPRAISTAANEFAVEHLHSMRI